MADGGKQMGLGFGGEEAEQLQREAGAIGEALVGLTRSQRRSRRKRVVRAKTLSVKRLPKRELEIGRLMYPEEDHGRPKTRGECQNGPRPCPFVSCAAHLKYDISPKTGAIKDNYPDVEVEDMKESCSLDLADRGGMTLEQVGEAMNITRERVRQIEVKSVANIKASGSPAALAIAEMAEAEEMPGERGSKGRRRLPLLPPAPAPAAGDEGGPDDVAGEFDEGGFVAISPGVFSAHARQDALRRLYAHREGRGERSASPPARPAPTYVPEAAPVSAFAGPAPAAAGADWSGRERALQRACERLGRFAADAALRAAGCAGESWMVARLVSAGLIRRDGDAFVWVGRAEAAE